jgi:hypothetical protein
MPTENERGVTIDQSARGDAIRRYDEARTEIGMDNKRTLSPVGPHQNIICTQESRRVDAQEPNRIVLNSRVNPGALPTLRSGLNNLDRVVPALCTNVVEARRSWVPMESTILVVWPPSVILPGIDWTDM